MKDVTWTPFGGTDNRGQDAGYILGRMQSEVVALAIPTKVLGYVGPGKKLLATGVELNGKIQKATNLVLLGRAGVNLTHDIREGEFDSGTAWSIFTVGATVVALSPRVEGFKSFSAFKRAKGSPGKGNVWHHIVEQRAANAERFGAEAIHSAKNVVAVRREVNQAIANYYSTVQPFTQGKTVRQWIGPQSWRRQYRYGQRVLKKALSGQPLP